MGQRTNCSLNELLHPCNAPNAQRRRNSTCCSQSVRWFDSSRCEKLTAQKKKPKPWRHSQSWWFRCDVTRVFLWTSMSHTTTLWCLVQHARKKENLWNWDTLMEHFLSGLLSVPPTPLFKSSHILCFPASAQSHGAAASPAPLLGHLIWGSSLIFFLLILVTWYQTIKRLPLLSNDARKKKKAFHFVLLGKKSPHTPTLASCHHPRWHVNAR